MNKNEAMDKLESHLKRLIDNGEWANFLKFAASFPSYSFHNRLMIWAQNPDATYVAGFKEWGKKGRYVKKGEKGMAIFAPLVKKDKNEETKSVIYGFRTVYVFDIEQTAGEPLPEAPAVHLLHQEVDEQLLQRMVDSCPFPVHESSDLNGANGAFYHTDGHIEILGTNPIAQKIKTLAHEWAHGLLHHRSGLPPTIKEVEAESTAFLVCQALGIDSSDYTFGYLIGWSGDDAVEILRDSMGRIQQASDAIIAAINSVDTTHSAIAS
ncbi:ArdC-like ssDNA-binding domain-containing protein [Sulfoacidibacillus ferrooxidans]|nr:ArdC-like ssDNA-binding domain-containing protein [Sulfoacidibacillus ferrooxidans]